MHPRFLFVPVASLLLIALPAAGNGEGRNSVYADFGGSSGSIASGPVAFAGFAHELAPAARWSLEVGIGPRPLREPRSSIPEIRTEFEPYSPLLLAGTGIELRGPVEGGSRIFAAGTVGLAYTREGGSTTIDMLSASGVRTSEAPARNLWSGMVGGALGMYGVARGVLPAPRFAVRAAYMPGYRDQSWLIAGTVGVGW